MLDVVKGRQNPDSIREGGAGGACMVER